MTYQVGDVVQIIDENEAWYPALLIVSEVKTWGVVADCLMPKVNTPGSHASIAPTRLPNHVIVKVGEAVILTNEVEP